MPMKNPPRPWTWTQARLCRGRTQCHCGGQETVAVARVTFSRVLNGQAGISPEMALKLEAAGWSNADFWMRLQAAYDLAPSATPQRERSGIRPLMVLV